MVPVDIITMLMAGGFNSEWYNKPNIYGLPTIFSQLNGRYGFMINFVIVLFILLVLLKTKIEHSKRDGLLFLVITGLNIYSVVLLANSYYHSFVMGSSYTWSQNLGIYLVNIVMICFLFIIKLYEVLSLEK